MPAPAVDALLFDLGNVLVEIDFERVFAAWAASAGLRIEEVRERFAFDAVHRAFEVGRLDAAAFFEHVRGLLRVPLPDETLAGGWNEVFVGEVAAMAGLIASVAGRVPLYVLSNTNSVHHVHWRARYAPILQPFDAVFVSCELGERKPDSAAFDAALRSIGAAPKRVGFFDDLAENVAGARALGMPSFVVSSAAQVRAAMATLGLVGGR
jgi:putative hydrolase of the HAD superfamily